jgi:hypothetical protein
MISLKNILLEVKTAEFINQLKTWENSIKKGWDSSKEKWFPHSSLESGTPTIAYGHKTKSQSEYKTGITDIEAVKLLMSDIDTAINKIKTVLNIKKFNSFPINVRQALVNATYRGELKSRHKTVKYIRTGQWSKVADEYLDNQEYRTGDQGVKTRMDWNAAQFRDYANKIAHTALKNDDIMILPAITEPTQEVTIKVNKQVLPIKLIVLKIYNSAGREVKMHRWLDVKQGILQFKSPADPGTYMLRLNNTASIKLQVQ